MVLKLCFKGLCLHLSDLILWQYIMEVIMEITAYYQNSRVQTVISSIVGHDSPVNLFIYFTASFMKFGERFYRLFFLVRITFSKSAVFEYFSPGKKYFMKDNRQNFGPLTDFRKNFKPLIFSPKISDPLKNNPGGYTDLKMSGPLQYNSAGKTS